MPSSNFIAADENLGVLGGVFKQLGVFPEVLQSPRVVRRVCESLSKEGLEPVRGMKIGSVRFLALNCPAPKQTVETLGFGKNRTLEIVESLTTRESAIQLRTILRKAERAMKNAGLITKPVQIGSRIFIPVVDRKAAPRAVAYNGNEVPPTVAATKKNRLQAAREDLSDRVAKKLKNPNGNPLMTVGEVAWALGKSTSSIYRFLDEGKLSWSKVHGRISTAMVMSLLQPTDL